MLYSETQFETLSGIWNYDANGIEFRMPYYANSEIGVIQPIKEIIKEIRHKRKEFHEKSADLVASNEKAKALVVSKRVGINFPYLHIDASQAGLYLNVNVGDIIQ